ncbi:glycosyltransferase [Priestia megaterium]|uniref:glycosyltransferase n=1 Tax=Priestia megaterium TaxID=1404 RepID=UPI001CD204A3|nr:glycosyltransferase [Priestia megaterium]
MIILHVAEYTKGGVATYLKNLINFQAKQDKVKKVYLVCSEQHGEEFIGLVDKKFKLYPYKYTRKLQNFLSAIFKIRKIIEEINPDIIHVHSSFAGMFVRINYFFQKKNVKIVYCSHGWSFLMDTRKLKKSLYAYIEKLLSFKTDAIVNISEYEYKNSLKYGIPASKSTIIYNGVSPLSKSNEVLDRKISFDTNKINLLFIGRFDRQKGIDILLNVFTRNNFENIKLHLIGDNVLSNSDINIPDNINSIGWVSSEEIDSFYKYADAIIMPSRWEGFGLVAVEAMKHKKAVIASDRGALPELIINEENGYVFKLDDEGSLTNILNSLTKEKLVSMGIKGYDRYESKFTSSVMNEKIISLYEKINN